MKKYILSTLTSLLMVFSLLAAMPIMTAVAETSGDYEYIVLDDGTVEVTKYNGTASNVIIPSTYGGKRISSIGAFAFAGKWNDDTCEYESNITRVSLPSGVKTIGDYAFAWCINLSYLYISDTVVSIGEGAFQECRTLTNVSLPNSVKTIGDNAFTWCENLSALTLSNTLTAIGEHTFDSCKSIKNVTIPDSTATIGDHAFDWCESLTGITVGANNTNYTSDDGVLFDKNKTVLIQYPAGKTAESYTIPYGVTTIGECAFYNCLNLRSVAIPYSVATIGAHAFDWCENLSIVEIPYNVSTVEENAFSNTDIVNEQETAVKYIGNWVVECDDDAGDVEIKAGTLGIADFAFGGSTGVTSVTVPDSVKVIGEGAFNDCESLESITVAANNQDYSSDDGVLFNKNKTTLIQYPIGKDDTSYSVPESVKVIESNAFANATELSDITISDKVESIRADAFYNTGAVNDQIEPVKYIGNWVVGCDTDAQSAELREGTVGIADSAFDSCDELESIVIPNSVASVGEAAFEDCESLSEVYYAGNEDAWEQIFIGNINDQLTNANIQYLHGHEHSYTSEITKQPSCTETGVKTFTCECGDSYTEDVPENGHSYTETVIPPTAQQGYTIHTCTVCGDKYKDNYTDPKQIDGKVYYQRSLEDSAVRFVIEVSEVDIRNAENGNIKLNVAETEMNFAVRNAYRSVIADGKLVYAREGYCYLVTTPVRADEEILQTLSAELTLDSCVGSLKGRVA